MKPDRRPLRSRFRVAPANRWCCATLRTRTRSPIRPVRPPSASCDGAVRRSRGHGVRGAAAASLAVGGRAPRTAPSGARRPANWVQLLKFGVVGASGYVVNLAVYIALLGLGRAQVAPRSRSSSRPRATTGGTATGRSPSRRATSRSRAIRFFVVSWRAFVVNQVWLFVFLDWLGLGEDRLAGARDRLRHAAELPREQALVVPPLRLVALAFALAGRAAARPPRRRDAASRGQQAAADDGAGDQALPRRPEGRRVARSATRRSRSPTRRSRRHVDGERLVGRRGRDRDRHGRRRDRRRDWRRGPGRRSRGRWRAAAGRVRRRADQQLQGLARLLRGVPARARRLAAAASRCGTSTCSRCSRSRSRSGSSTAATSSRRCRSSIPACVWLLARSLWIGRSDRASRGGVVWPVWVLVAATVFSGSPRSTVCSPTTKARSSPPPRRSRGSRASAHSPHPLDGLLDPASASPIFIRTLRRISWVAARRPGTGGGPCSTFPSGRQDHRQDRRSPPSTALIVRIVARRGVHP